jgi:hypothetical protein
MKGWKMAAIFTAIALGALVTTGVSATIGWRPVLGPRVRPLTNRTFEAIPARLERGRYLTSSGGVACVLC